MRLHTVLFTVMTLFYTMNASAQQYIGFSDDQKKQLETAVLGAQTMTKLATPVFERNELKRIAGVNLSAFADAMMAKPVSVEDTLTIKSIDYVYEEACEDIAHVVHFEEPEGSRVYAAKVYICPYFFTMPEKERVASILHENTHVITGPGECRAMLMEFWIPLTVEGKYIFTEWYWNQSKCSPDYDAYLPSAEYREYSK